MPKVSICIAVYNVEKYIEQCVRSLFEQTLDDLEYIFVDDASPDASIDVMLRVLEDYPHRKHQVKLLRHETNQGVAVTRKDAIAVATGEYIIHCDPDDWVELDMYEKMYSQAVETNADMVWCNVKSFGWSSVRGKTEYHHQGREGMIKGILCGDIHGGLCNKLWKSELVKRNVDLSDDIFLCEDMRLNIQYLLDSCEYRFLSDSLYCYRKSENSVSGHVNAGSVACQVKNILFFEKILDKKIYGHSLDHMKLDILMQALIWGGMTFSQWHSFWMSAKVGIVKSKYSFKQKGIFCVRY